MPESFLNEPTARFAGWGGNRAATEGADERHRDEQHHGTVAERFAARVADQLEHHALQGEYDALTLIAEPQFLGLLRKKFKHAVTRRISESFPKDLVTETPAELLTHLA